MRRVQEAPPPAPIQGRQGGVVWWPAQHNEAIPWIWMKGTVERLELEIGVQNIHKSEMGLLWHRPCSKLSPKPAPQNQISGNPHFDMEFRKGQLYSECTYIILSFQMKLFLTRGWVGGLCLYIKRYKRLRKPFCRLFYV